MNKTERAVKSAESRLENAKYQLFASGGNADTLEKKLRQIAIAEVTLEALQEKQERDSPKPLTLDELRERNGKPVWCEYINMQGERRNGVWCICRVIYGNIQPMNGYAVGHTNTSTLCYSKTWLAYDFEPKEGAE